MIHWDAHYYEGHDERGRRFLVRPCVGMRAAVVQDGLGEEVIHWQEAWEVEFGKYSPACTRTADALVKEFLRRRVLRQRGTPEQINAELLVAARETRPARSPRTHDDSQLPVGDRA